MVAATPYPPDPAVPDQAPPLAEDSGGEGGGVPSGVKRRHQRIAAPLDVVIDRKPYPALDWSLTGFAIAPNAVPVVQGQRLRFVARFHIRGALLSMPMEAEVARLTPERLGCRFINVAEDQLHLLRLLHAAHRTGRAPLWEGVLAPQGSGAASPHALPLATPEGGRRPSRPATPRFSFGPLRGWRPHRAVLAGVLLLLATVTLGFGVMQLLRDSESRFAVLSLPGRTLTAPAGGTVDAILARPGDRVGPQTVVLRLRATGRASGEMARDGLVLAPCVCVLRDILVQPGQPVSPGTPLARLAAGSGPAEAVVEALFPADEAQDLHHGTEVQIRLAGLPALFGGRVLPTSPGGASALPPTLTEGTGGVTVRVAFDRLPADSAAALYDGQPARVRLNRTLSGAAGGLFARLLGG